MVESLRACFRDGLAMSLLCWFLGFIDNSYPAQVRPTLEGNLFYLKVCVPNYLINAKRSGAPDGAARQKTRSTCCNRAGWEVSTLNS